MAEKNPIFSNGLYFFSDLYSDDLISIFYNRITEETYNRSVRYQRNAQGGIITSQEDDHVYKMHFGDFVDNSDYNRRVGLPLKSWTMRLPSIKLPVANMGRFLRKYGGLYQKIPLDDFISHPEIFGKRFEIFMGKYELAKATIVLNKDDSITLALPYHKTEQENAYTDENFAKLKGIFSDSDDVIISLVNPSKSFYYNDDLISTAVADGQYYLVTVNKTSQMNKIIERNEESNSWDFVAYERFNSNLYLVTHTSVRSSDANTITFAIPAQQFNYIRPLIGSGDGGKYGYFIKRGERRSVISYVNSGGRLPVFDFSYIENALSGAHISVFEIDTNYNMRGRRLYDTELIQSFYPNIFDFSEFFNSANPVHSKSNTISIEVYEWLSMDTNQKFRDSLAPLRESLGSFYTNFAYEGLDGGAGIQEFNPTAAFFDHRDYYTDKDHKSPYYGDIRGYYMDKLVNVIQSDPYTHSLYYKFMHERDPRIITSSGTPKKFKFNTGLNGEFSGSNPIIMNTTEINPNIEPCQFTEPHSYMAYRTAGKASRAMVYLNGRLIQPTLHLMIDGVNVIFFPVSLIHDVVSQYATEEDLLNASPITVDIFPDSFFDYENVISVTCPIDENGCIPFKRIESDGQTHVAALAVNHWTCLIDDDGIFLDTETYYDDGYRGSDEPYFRMMDLLFINFEGQMKNWREYIDIKVQVNKYTVQGKRGAPLVIDDDDELMVSEPEIEGNPEFAIAVSDPIDEPTVFYLLPDQKLDSYIAKMYGLDINSVSYIVEKTWISLTDMETDIKNSGKFLDETSVVSDDDRAVMMSEPEFPGDSDFATEVDDPISKYNLLMYKKLDMQYVKFDLKYLDVHDPDETDPFMAMRITTRNYYNDFKFNYSQLERVDDHYEVTLAHANKDMPDDFSGEEGTDKFKYGCNGRYLVFRNGLLITNCVVMAKDLYDDGEMLVIIYDECNPGDEFLLVHMPYDLKMRKMHFFDGLRYMKPGVSGSDPSEIWPDGYTPFTDGLVLTDLYPDESGCYGPLEMEENIKFTSNGYRMAPSKKKTFTESKTYYSPEECAQMPDKTFDSAFVFKIACGLDITKGTDLHEHNVLENLFTER